jgi:hypothetical protein
VIAINRTFAGASEDRNTSADVTSAVEDVSHHVFRHQNTLRLLLWLVAARDLKKARSQSVMPAGIDCGTTSNNFRMVGINAPRECALLAID